MSWLNPPSLCKPVGWDTSHPPPSSPACTSTPPRREGSLDIRYTRSSAPRWMVGKPPRPLGDRKSFLPRTHCVICALVSSHCPRCEAFFVANPELLTAACLPFGALFPGGMQPCCLAPFSEFGFPFQFSNMSLSYLKRTFLLKNLNRKLQGWSKLTPEYFATRFIHCLHLTTFVFSLSFSKLL